MASNLKSRLQRIRNMAQAETPQAVSLPAEKDFSCPSCFGNEWLSVGHKVLKKIVMSNVFYNFSENLPEELKILVPDFFKINRKIISPENIIFFDLETTGLSGGAGTIAFLAAVGHFVPTHDAYNHSLQIDQYLLLDYPGEPDFLEMLIPVLNHENKIVVTYNGKTFDTKLFRTRCLMNGMKPPMYQEADLLHPARRLWKNILPNCSQAEIETSILGLDRTGDISGAFAPQIWFDFLNSQNPSELLAICDHNKKDIEGLASLFFLITQISAHPWEMLQTYSFDIEAATLQWRKFARCFPENPCITQQAERLMLFCVEKKFPKTTYLYGYDLMKNGFHDKGISLFNELLDMDIPFSLKISVLNNLAIDTEWRLKDNIRALNYVDALLRLEYLSESFRNKVQQRRERLLKKIFF